MFMSPQKVFSNLRTEFGIGIPAGYVISLGLLVSFQKRSLGLNIDINENLLLTYQLFLLI